MAELAQYPLNLPMPLQSSQSVSTVSPLVTTTMQTGRRRQRRAYTSTPQIVKVSFLMSDEQTAMFEGWYRWGITDGADWFTARLRTPLGIKPVTMRFTGIYDGPNPEGFLLYKISGEVELRYRQTYTEQETADAIAGGDFHQAVIDLGDAASIYYTRYWEA